MPPPASQQQPKVVTDPHLAAMLRELTGSLSTLAHVAHDAAFAHRRAKESAGHFAESLDRSAHNVLNSTGEFTRALAHLAHFVQGEARHGISDAFRAYQLQVHEAGGRLAQLGRAGPRGLGGGAAGGQAAAHEAQRREAAKAKSVGEHDPWDDLGHRVRDRADRLRQEKFKAGASAPAFASESIWQRGARAAQEQAAQAAAGSIFGRGIAAATPVALTPDPPVAQRASPAAVARQQALDAQRDATARFKAREKELFAADKAQAGLVKFAGVVTLAVGALSLVGTVGTAAARAWLGLAQATGPAGWNTLSKSFEVLAGTIGRELVPDMIRLARWAQETARWAADNRDTVKGGYEFLKGGGRRMLPGVGPFFAVKDLAQLLFGGLSGFAPGAGAAGSGKVKVDLTSAQPRISAVEQVWEQVALGLLQSDLDRELLRVQQQAALDLARMANGVEELNKKPAAVGRMG